MSWCRYIPFATLVYEIEIGRESFDLRRGQSLLVFLGAGNMDPNAFPDPQKFQYPIEVFKIYFGRILQTNFFWHQWCQLLSKHYISFSEKMEIY